VFVATGEATGSVPVKFGIGADGRQIPISERIALALQIKREQQQHSESALKGRVVSEGRTNGLNDSARSTPSKGRPAKNPSGKSRSATSKQGRERADEPLDPVGGSAARNEFGAMEDGDEEGGGAGDGQDQDQHGAQEFLEYASPAAAARKSSSSRAVSRSKKAEDREASEEDNTDGRDQAQAAQPLGTASDWIECLDPRSKRKYYYSATLKKSTWTKPAGYSGSVNSRHSPGTPVLATMGVTMPSRYNSPNLSMHMTGRQPLQSTGDTTTQRMTAEELTASSSSARDETSQNTLAARSSSLRSASPFETAAASPSPSVQIDFAKVFSSSSRNEPAAVHGVGKASTYSSRSSSPAPSTTASSAKAVLRSGSPSVRTALMQSPARGAGEQDWVTAVDPNSNRKYWYNR